MEFSLHLPLFLKMQGNEVEAVKTPTVRSWEIYLMKSRIKITFGSGKPGYGK
jgi:hypothetical protein